MYNVCIGYTWEYILFVNLSLHLYMFPYLLGLSKLFYRQSKSKETNYLEEIDDGPKRYEISFNTADFKGALSNIILT